VTSLNETLPVLDVAVPALPARLEEVATKSDAFHQAAGEVVAVLQARRDQADALVTQVRQALAALRERGEEREKSIADSARALEDMAEEQLRELDAAEGGLTTEGAEARTALGALETQLAAGTQRTRAAHEEARAALEAFAEEARNRQPELEAAGDAMEQALKGAQQAIADGQELVSQGVTAVQGAMERLLAQAQARLDQTSQYLDTLRDEHATGVGQALSSLEDGREQLGLEMVQALHTTVQEALGSELDAVVSTLAEVGQQVVELESETEARREELARQVAEVEERIGPLQEGARQVQGAAERLGIAWP
jgi:uncharacterized phage infection (PIP) family protein YhgE